MKKFLSVLLGLCCGAALFAAVGSTTPHGWHDEFAGAQAQARELNRPMLLLLTGSDWCPFCQKLKREVLDTREFKDFARRHLVLVYADIPRYAELPHRLVKQNRALAERFNVRGYPTAVILAPDGRELGRIGGFAPGYLDRVKNILRNGPRAAGHGSPGVPRGMIPRR